MVWEAPYQGGEGVHQAVGGTSRGGSTLQEAFQAPTNNLTYDVSLTDVDRQHTSVRCRPAQLCKVANLKETCSSACSSIGLTGAVLCCVTLTVVVAILDTGLTNKGLRLTFSTRSSLRLCFGTVARRPLVCVGGDNTRTFGVDFLSCHRWTEQLADRLTA